MRKIFINPKLQSDIERDGYIIIRDFLDANEVENLIAAQDRLSLAPKDAFHMSNWSKDTEKRTKIYQTIADTLHQKGEAYLHKYKPVLGCFAVKPPCGETSEMDVHQDWALVDESAYRSVSIWAALCDMDKSNGALEVWRGSHEIVTDPRGQNIPVPFEAVKDGIKRHCFTGLELKAGDAVIFEHRLVHGSPPNNTQKARRAAVLALIPEEASLVHYFRKPEGGDTLELLELRNDLYIKFDFFNYAQKPEHTATLAYLPYKGQTITAENFG